MRKNNDNHNTNNKNFLQKPLSKPVKGDKADNK